MCIFFVKHFLPHVWFILFLFHLFIFHFLFEFIYFIYLYTFLVYICWSCHRILIAIKLVFSTRSSQTGFVLEVSVSCIMCKSIVAVINWGFLQWQNIGCRVSCPVVAYMSIVYVSYVSIYNICIYICIYIYIYICIYTLYIYKLYKYNYIINYI